MSKKADRSTKMRTSREVYDRIRWDARFDPAEFWIGYEARLEDLKEIPFSQYDPGGDIPWHRIWYFRRGQSIVWDRRTRVDLIFGGAMGDAPAKAAPAAEAQPERASSVMTALRFDPEQGQWVPAPATEDRIPTSARSLRVVTLNVLVDTYDADRIHTALRIPAILSLLEAADADLIGLQEVTKPFLDRLLEEPWVREGYFVSDGPEARTVEPYGQVLLSRFPVRHLEQVAFSPRKRVLVAIVAASAGIDIVVPVLHLTSNRAKNAAETRAQQLATLDELLEAAGVPETPCVVLGDFNFGDDGSAALDAYTDAWRALRPGDPGHTFDPGANALAAITSTTGRAGRYDRILVRARPGVLTPASIALIGREPIAKGVYPSDHFGVAGEIAIGTSLTAVAPVHRSAVAILPPQEVWGPIQAIREQFDKHVERWMPHVNLLYGFLPEEHFPAAAALLADALRGVAPFTITFAEFGRFDHRASTTVWLRPRTEPEGAIEALQAKLQAVFPQCDEQSEVGEHGFTPHHSVAQFRKADEAEKKMAEWRRRWHPLSFRVSSIALISRRGDEPFAVRHEIPLGGAAPRTGILERLQAAAIAGAEGRDAPVLHALGSTRLGVRDAQSDVDVLFVGPWETPREAFFERLRATLDTARAITAARVVTDAIAPVLKLVMDGTEVDVSYARLPEGAPATALADPAGAAQLALDPASTLALRGVLEADALLARATARVTPERFRSLLISVKRWARARALVSNAFGLLGGFSWAVLAAWVCARDEGAFDSDEALLARFFSVFAEWEWPRPVSLDPAGDDHELQGARDRMPVLTPLAPFRNSARNVTRSTLAVLRDELARGARILAGGGTERLDAPIDPFAAGAQDAYLVTEASSRSPADLRECVGFIESRVIGLVLDLEREGRTAIRPYPEPVVRVEGGRATARFVLGAGAAAGGRAAIASFEADFRAWDARPEGSQLRVIEARDTQAAR